MMENTYRPQQNKHAFKRFSVRQFIPSKSLNIGTDENLTSQPVKVFKDAHANMLKVAQVDNLKRPVENVGVVGDGVVVSDNDFISGDMFLGSAIEVF